jgi:tripartite ATP-independent transporter DctP family solute receptor
MSIGKKDFITIGMALSLVFFAASVTAGGKTETKSAEIYNMVVANELTEAHVHSKALAFFSQRVGELTNGRMKLTVHNSGVLGSGRVVMEQLQLGTTQFTRTGHAVLTGVVPEIAIFGLPYLFDDVNHMHKTLEGSLGEYLQKKLEAKGLIVLGWYDYGARSIIAKVPIRRPEDLAGKRIRVQESPLDIKSFQILGASPVPLPWGDQYPALDSGVIDATENAPDTIYDGRFHEVAKFYSLTEHFIQPTPLYMSKIVFDKLPKDLQEKVIQAGKDSVGFIKENQPKKIEEGLRLIQQGGATIIRDIDKQAFRQKTLPVYEEFFKTYPDLRPFVQGIQKK